MTPRLILIAALPLVCAVLTIPGADLYYRTSRGKGCAGCHEIRANFDTWRGSSHRKLNCTDCHASTTSDNLRRMSTHFAGEIPEQIHLETDGVFAMTDKCRSCHQQEFAQWSGGGHSATYSRIFTNAEHNRKRLPIDDCFRCHGMHFEGSISDMIRPVDSIGPWKLVEPALAERPAIPCLGCHVVHREGQPVVKVAQRLAVREEIAPPSLGLFDRRSRTNIRLDALPLPAIVDGARAVRLSRDSRQALCYQCHAPLAAAQARSGDDRTPLGVHEGISCLGCHEKHSQNTRQSCATCHPRLSNCGIDVEKMDTTFANLKSAHNIHTVKCLDCHPKGVPKRRMKEEER